MGPHVQLAVTSFWSERRHTWAVSFSNTGGKTEVAFLGRMRSRPLPKRGTKKRSLETSPQREFHLMGKGVVKIKKRLRVKGNKHSASKQRKQRDMAHSVTRLGSRKKSKGLAAILTKEEAFLHSRDD